MKALVAVASGSSISAMLPECRCLGQFDADADNGADAHAVYVDADAGAWANWMIMIKD